MARFVLPRCNALRRKEKRGSGFRIQHLKQPINGDFPNRSPVTPHFKDLKAFYSTCDVGTNTSKVLILILDFHLKQPEKN